MTRPRWTFRIIRRVWGFRWRSTALLLVVSIIGAALVVGVATTHSSAERAYLQGLLAQRGPANGFVVQAPDRLQPRLSRFPGLTQVDSRNTAVSTSSGQVEATAWSVSSGSLRTAFQHLQQGRRPNSDGEAALSEYVMGALGLHLGDDVTLELDGVTAQRSVVGVTQNPGNNRYSSILLGGNSLAGRGTYWIATPNELQNLRADQALGPAIDAGQLSITSNAATVDAGTSDLPPRIAILRPAAWVLGAAMSLLVFLVLSGLRKTTSRDIANLTAAGVPRSSASRLIHGAAAALLGTGALAGGAGAVSGVFFFSASVDDWFGTSWVDVSPAWGVYFVAVVIAAIAAPALSIVRTRSHVTLRAVTVRRAATVAPTARCALIRTAAIATGLVLVGLEYGAIWSLSIPLLSTVIGATLVAWGLTHWLGVVVTRRLPPASRRVALEIAKRRAAFALIAYFLAAMTSAYALLTTHDATASAAYDEGLQPPGSLLALQVPSRAQNALLRQYRALGGARASSFGLPSSPRGDVRGQNPKAKATNGPPLVAFVGFDSTLALDAVSAQPELVDASGNVEIVLFGESGEEAVGTFRARAVDELGGNLPGVFIHPQGKLARSLEMMESGFVELALLDFENLQPKNAATMRGLLDQYAPSALISTDEEASPLAQDLATARSVSATGAILASGIFGIGAFLVGLTYRGLQRTLAQLPMPRRRRLRVLVANVVVEVAPVTIVGLSLAVTVDRASTAPPGGQSGQFWALPLVMLILLMIISAIVFWLFAPTDRRDG